MPVPLATAAGSLRSSAPLNRWAVVETRILNVDGVHVQYEFAQMRARDSQGALRDYACVTLRRPSGCKEMPSTGFAVGMSDSQLAKRIRDIG